MKRSRGCWLFCTALVACSQSNATGSQQLSVALTMGSDSANIDDHAPVRSFLSEQFLLTSSVSTQAGNKIVVQLASNEVTGAAAYPVGIGKSVQIGFTMPGTSGTIYFETGSLSLATVDWTAGSGRIEGTMTGLHRPADALGVAPEATASGAFAIGVPAQ